MSFGKDLSIEFEKLTAGVFYPEEDLFCKFQDALLALKNHYPKYRYAVDIIHGRKSHVDFAYKGSAISSISYGTTKTKEMADMMFVVLGNRFSEIRLTYLQNKKGSSSTRFKADLLQLYLLKERPQIISSPLPQCAFNDSDILHNAILPSVGSYGVFYENGSSVEMSYIPAGNILPLRKTGKSIVRSAQTSKSNFGKIKTISGFEESQGEETVHDFGESLIAMTIGTPFLNADRDTKFSTIISYLAKKSSTVGEWLRFQDNSLLQDVDNDKEDWLTGAAVTIVINSDEIRNAK